MHPRPCEYCFRAKIMVPVSRSGMNGPGLANICASWPSLYMCSSAYTYMCSFVQLFNIIFALLLYTIALYLSVWRLFLIHSPAVRRSSPEFDVLPQKKKRKRKEHSSFSKKKITCNCVSLRTLHVYLPRQDIVIKLLIIVTQYSIS